MKEDMMNEELMEIMVADFIADHFDEMEDLILDGKPYYDAELEQWVQDAHDNKNTYTLANIDGSIEIRS